MAAPFPDGFHPFWFWNDRVTADGIARQVAAMAAQGVRGFFIHSRQGLDVPYLSSAFLDLVEVAFAEARAHGLTVHLYDEYPYPSGAAGGATVQSDPALTGTRLWTTSWACDGGAVRRELPPGKVLVCAAFPVHGAEVDWGRTVDLAQDVGMLLTRESLYEGGIGPYNDRRYFADTPVPVLDARLPEGRWEICAVSQVAVADHKYWGSFPDMVDPRAVERFLELTHDRYRERLGDGLGGAASLFVDEVAPERSATVLAEIARRHPGELDTWLVALACPAHPRHLETAREMDEVRLELFAEAFESRVSAWCSAHGLRYAGEKPSIRLSQLAWMDVPGCEPGHTKAGAPRSDLLRAAIRSNARATASAAYLYAKEGSLCECYHSLGWGATLQDAKLIAESLLALGTRWLVPHAFFYSTRGLRKYDAPPSFFQMPHWPLFGALTARIDGISAAFDGSWMDAEVAVVEPSAAMPDATQLACYEEFQHRLVAVGCDFLTVDLDVLAPAPIVDGGVSVRDVTIRAVVVPPGRLPVPGLDRWLAEFEAGGGLVARVGAPADIDPVLAAVRARCPPALAVSTSPDTPSPLVATCRRAPDGRRWLVVNTSGTPVDIELVASRLPVPAPVDLGDAPPAPVRWDGRHGRARLGPFESLLLAEPSVVLRRGALRLGTEAPPVVRIPTAGTWSLRPLGPNVARLGSWQLELDGRRAAAPVEPAPIANQLRRAGIDLVPVITERFGMSPTLALPRMHARYETAVACIAAPARLSVVMEPGAISGDWEMFVDGSGPFRRADFSPGRGPVDGCVVLELPACPATHRAGAGSWGRHDLVVEVDVAGGNDGLVDVLYLAGDVAVGSPPPPGLPERPRRQSDGPEGPTGVRTVATLVQPRGQGELGAWEASGLPYFAGTLELSRPMAIEVPLGTSAVTVELDLPQWVEDAVELSFGDGPWHPLPWSPRRVVIDTGEIRKGTGPAGALVRLRVHTTLLRAFEGRWFDTSVHASREVELRDLGLVR